MNNIKLSKMPSVVNGGVYRSTIGSINFAVLVLLQRLQENSLPITKFCFIYC